MSLDLAMHVAVMDSGMGAAPAIVANHASSASAPLNDHGFAYHRMPGRGGRRCDDPVVAHGGGGCSE
jgi:hypothetical protein